jgi:hypothetical protein
MDEELLKEEQDLMIQIFGEIVSLEKLEDWLAWEEEQRQMKLETQQSFPY